MNTSALKKVMAIIALIFAHSFHATAQTFNSDIQTHSNYTAISTAFPFLRVMPDARSAAMGEAGVAVDPDANVLSINPAKLVFIENKSGLSFSYNPWFKRIINDMNLSYLSAYLNNGRQAIGLSLRYFSIGEVEYINEQAATTGVLRPIENAADFSYARKFSQSFSMATSLRFVQSRLQLNDQQTGMSSSGSAIVADVSAYFTSPAQIAGHEGKWSAGINLSNIGSPLADFESATKSFMPTNIKLGAAATIMPDDQNQVTFALDLNKLLVPTRPGNFPGSIFNSFTDAEGGLREELSEVGLAFGVEYWLQNKFALRTGYIYEHPEKGNRRYLSFGAGLKFEHWNADLAYLPTSIEKSAMANSVKVTLMFNFGQLEHKHKL
jgi:hypothetical protein